mmetsp:Transcript_2913/g.4404  ORF Transcript_2913/g.4404 Transcript_2913/m.4404 type:complete len:154 (+) Transcript_2913:53-514(+)|eukprot:CAMPEP_0197235106 /NCGR_PEP_ID=MMETSP1429-20130617/2618_1 /TAXON_ID=49237 /ORGANISM="Chaetoceros  sp., Strain UNC1202" /LENGTH=153 /DNA_ID=CAMNT_0042693621 /DNA_START=53 /DNA_END=514 /DNA_ORIENTATION=-
MLPLLILVVPPSVAGGSYGSWYLGQQTALLLTSTSRTSSAPPLDAPSQSTASYISGIVTLVGAYGLQCTQFSRLESDADPNRHTPTKVHKGNSQEHPKFVPPHKKASTAQFQAPQNVAEAFERVGRPMLIRAGAGGVALFCAGVVQTVVATKI